MAEKTLLDSAIIFGPGMFFAVVLLYFSYKLLAWVLKSSSDREERLVAVINSAHESIGKNVAELGKIININAIESQQRYITLQEAGRFQREEHGKMLDLHAAALREVENLAQVVKDFECRAHTIK